MEVILGFMALMFVAGMRRPEGRVTPRTVTVLVLAVVVAATLLSHKVA